MDLKAKKIIYGQDVRNKILSGVSKTERAVGTTLGSKGRNVAIEQNWGSATILHDGVSVARKVILEDPFENVAAGLVIDAAQKTNNEAGDGTTTATILTNAIVKEAMPLVSAGINPAIIRKGIEKILPFIVKNLKTMAKPIRTFDEMKAIATISAADADMGELIATAIQKVGEAGVVTVQEGTGSTIVVEYKEGMDLSRGWLSPYFINNEQRMETVFEAEKKGEDISFPYVITVNEKLDNNKIVSIAAKILKHESRPQFLIIADEFDNEAIQTLLLSKMKGGVRLAAIRAPEFGEHRSNLLSDIAFVTGGKLIGGLNGIPIEQVEITDIGRAEKIVISKDQTIIIGGKGQPKEIEDHINGIKKMMNEEKDDGVKDKYQNRLAKLIGGVAVISVGALSETEMREKKERVFDAVNATKAAIAEGVVPGGGVALVRAGNMIEKMRLTDKERIGANILKQALTYPMRRLVQNVGIDDPGLVVGKIQEHQNKNWGYNVDSEQYEDLVKQGIIDPVKVTRCALQNAASIAIMLITTDCMIVEKREKKKEKEEDEEGIGRFLD